VILQHTYVLEQHFRNFATELPNKVDSKGFREAGPNLTAQVLFQNLSIGDDVALTSRFNNLNLIPYLQAFQARGIHAHVVLSDPTSKLSGVYDLCYLMKAKRRFVGSAISTYARWAAFLGDAEEAQLYIYSYDGLKTVTKGHDLMDLLGFQWKHPVLQKRVKWRLIADDDLR
jgi:hypothetical protein